MASRGMLGAQTRIAELLLPQRPFRIGCLVATAALQLWRQQVDDVHKRFGANDEGEIEPIEIRVVGPTLELIGNARGRTDDDRTDAASRDVLRDLTDRPAAIGVGARDVLESGAAGFALHMFNDLVR